MNIEAAPARWRRMPRRRGRASRRGRQRRGRRGRASAARDRGRARRRRAAPTRPGAGQRLTAKHVLIPRRRLMRAPTPPPATPAPRNHARRTAVHVARAGSNRAARATPRDRRASRVGVPGRGAASMRGPDRRRIRLEMAHGTPRLALIARARPDASRRPRPAVRGRRARGGSTRRLRDAQRDALEHRVRELLAPVAVGQPDEAAAQRASSRSPSPRYGRNSGAAATGSPRAPTSSRPARGRRRPARRSPRTAAARPPSAPRRPWC